MMPFDDDLEEDFDPDLIDPMFELAAPSARRRLSGFVPFEEDELDGFDPELLELMLDGPPNFEGRRMRWEQIAALMEEGGAERIFAGADPDEVAHLRVVQALALEDAIFAMEFPDDQ